MSPDFTHSLASILRRLESKSPVPPDPADTAQHALEAERQHRREWFARFAAQRVMPLLEHTAQAIERTGERANCRLNDSGGTLAAELVIIPRNLPKGSPPPRLAISSATGERALSVDCTGTFPNLGATGGFGAEIDYDAIYPSQIEDKVIDFVALATGA